MHFTQPVQVARSTTRPLRVMCMASGGQSGMHMPHSSQRSWSTMATWWGFGGMGES